MGGTHSAREDEEAHASTGARTPQQAAVGETGKGGGGSTSSSPKVARRATALEELAQARAVAQYKSQTRAGKPGAKRRVSRDEGLSAAELALEVEVAGRERYTKWRLVDVRGAWRRAQDIVPMVRRVVCLLRAHARVPGPAASHVSDHG